MPSHPIYLLFLLILSSNVLLHLTRELFPLNLQLLNVFPIFLLRTTCLTHIVITDRRNLGVSGEAPRYAILPSPVTPISQVQSFCTAPLTLTGWTAGHGWVL